jgi:hypothetical protein
MQPWMGFGSTCQDANLVGHGWANFHSGRTHFLEHFPPPDLRGVGG